MQSSYEKPSSSHLSLTIHPIGWNKIAARHSPITQQATLSQQATRPTQPNSPVLSSKSRKHAQHFLDAPWCAPEGALYPQHFTHHPSTRPPQKKPPLCRKKAAHAVSAVLVHELGVKVLEALDDGVHHVFGGQDGGAQVEGSGRLPEARPGDREDAGLLQQLQAVPRVRRLPCCRCRLQRLRRPPPLSSITRGMCVRALLPLCGNRAIGYSFGTR